MSDSLFPSKLLLFGEYAIINGAKGLAIPFQQYHGHLDFQDSDSEYKEEFLSFYKYLENLDLLKSELDLDKFRNDIDNNIYFNSNIPKGAGVGSSGALCASIYKRYLKKDLSSHDDLKNLIDRMALMESFYHGSSSGLDPLISLINRPMLVENRNQLTEVHINSELLTHKLFLYNTGIYRKTSPLVHLFLEKIQDTNFKQKLDLFISFNDQAITALLEANIKDLDKLMYSISKWQYLNISEMIPNQIKEIWLEGIESKTYYMKLCGAGGGGHYFVYKENDQVNLDNFKDILKIF